MLNVRKLFNIYAEKNKLCKWCTECENILQEIYWIWEIFVKDVLNVRNFCMRCTECVNIM